MREKAACFPKEELRRGAWTEQEDKVLSDYIESHGLGRWRSLPVKAGLNRFGKSCRLRWQNYLRPGIKRGNITDEEEELIIRLHKLFGNRWSLIAGRIPGRTDNEIKNYWNSYLKKKVAAMDVSESQSSSKATPTTITTTEKANERKNKVSVTSLVKSKTIQSANSVSTSEDLNENNSAIHEEHLVEKVQAHQEVCPPAFASSDYGLEFRFGELSNGSIFSGYGWRDANSMAGSSIMGDVCHSKIMEGDEEMSPFIAEVEWESLIK